MKLGAFQRRAILAGALVMLVATSPKLTLVVLAVVPLVVGPLVRKRPRAMVGVPTVNERCATAVPVTLTTTLLMEPSSAVTGAEKLAPVRVPAVAVPLMV